MPKPLLENLKFRRFILTRAAKSKRLQTALLDVCRNDFFLWVNCFVLQFNPNTIGTASPEIGPFVTWEFQEDAAREILAAIETRKDLVIEKSREMGASWLCLLILTWFYLFHPWKKFLVISRSEEAVDKPDDPDSLFWKIDFVLEHLPAWMTAGSKRRKKGYKHLHNKSTIIGQASTGKAGVGGRATAMFIDEFSQIREDYEVLQRTSDTTSCRIFNGTHVGLETAFYNLTNPSQTSLLAVKKLVMHWTQHPDKRRGLYRYDAENNKVEILDKSYAWPPNYDFQKDGRPTGGPHPGVRSPWYDDQVGRKGSARAVAMDLDIDPRGSVSQFFDPFLIRNLIGTYAAAPDWEGDLLFEEDSGQPIRLQHRLGGPLRLWCPLHGDKPAPGIYAFGCDVSTGEGASPSCASGGKWPEGEKVVEYASAFIEPGMFGAMMVALCRLFAQADGTAARLAWEIAGPGLTFGKKVVQLGFGNIYYREVNPVAAGGKQSETPGWLSTPSSKPVLLRDYLEGLRTRQFLNRSERALDETLAFKYTKTGGIEHGGESSVDDPTGARVNHGDLVIADSLCWRLLRAMGKVGKKKEETEVKYGSLAWRRELHRQKESAATSWFANV